MNNRLPALDLADWSPVRNRADITVFDRHLSEDEAVEALQPFDVLCAVISIHLVLSGRITRELLSVVYSTPSRPSLPGWTKHPSRW
jgi:hypothetical protein